MPYPSSHHRNQNSKTPSLNHFQSVQNPNPLIYPPTSSPNQPKSASPEPQATRRTTKTHRHSHTAQAHIRAQPLPNPRRSPESPKRSAIQSKTVSFIAISLQKFHLKSQVSFAGLLLLLLLLLLSSNLQSSSEGCI
jgi:hypothetical protein